jgi:polyhydroxyalkanoate synthesis regulator phasin
MAFESVRSYVQLASGLGELTRAKAMDAAQGLLSLPGLDEVTKRAVQASALADQLLEGARANQASLVALVQQEVESALRRADVARVADLDAARSALATVSRELADLRDTVVTTGVAAVGGAASRGSRGARTGSPATALSGSLAGADAGPASTSSAVTTRRSGSATSSPPAKASSSAKKTTAKKTTAKKTTAKKTTAKKTARR